MNVKTTSEKEIKDKFEKEKITLFLQKDLKDKDGQDKKLHIHITTLPYDLRINGRAFVLNLLNRILEEQIKIETAV